MAENMMPADVLRTIDNAWRNGTPEEMRPYLHPDIILQLPGFEGQTVGADAIIGGYAEFLGMVTVDSFEPSEPHVDMIGETAIVNYTYTMRYTMGDGKSYDASGRELWVLRKNTEGQWQAVWRTMLETVEKEVTG